MNGFLCGWLPEFHLQGAAKHMPRPPAIATERMGPLEVVAGLNPAARAADIKPGLPVAQALGRCPGLLRWPRSLADERTLTERLRRTADAMSPHVQIIGTDVALLDFHGLERLHGSWRRAASAWVTGFGANGFELRTGFAAQPALALIATRSKLEELPPGGEGAQLAPLPIHLLADLHELTGTLATAGEVAEMLLLFERWGIRTLGALAKLPQAALAARLGQAGIRLRALARGEVDGILDTSPAPAMTLAAGSQFDPPLVNLEVFKAAVAHAISELSLQLEQHDRVAEYAQLRVIQEFKRPEAIYGHSFAAPTRDPQTLAAQIGLTLEHTPPSGEIHAFEIELRLARPRRVQARLFSAASPDRAKLPKLLGLLSEMFPGRMGSPQLEASHRPQAFALAPYSPRGESEAEPAPTAPQALALALRVYRPPQPLNHAEIVRRAGPWRGCGNWWREASDARGDSGPWACDEWDAELRMHGMERSGLYRLLHDPAHDRWYILGRYD
ncbi:MAG TPA: hypothetical protein VNE83_07360 [Terriglobales bacterium]|nr:hypothetical protein [Terriglobales bacterium]